MDPRLGRLKPTDWHHVRKYSLSAAGVTLPAPTGDRYWSAPVTYDQGTSPDCVGASTAALLSSMAEGKYSESVTFDYHKIYVWAQAHDDEAGTPHDGTTVRAGMECVVANAGSDLSINNPDGEHIDAMAQFLWAPTSAEALSYLFEYSGIVIGINWYDSMFQPDENFVLQIPPTAQLAGGHAVFVRGGDASSNMLVIHNSWGLSWGKRGDAYISYANFERLLREDGEAAALVNTPYEINETNIHAGEVGTATGGNVVNPFAQAQEAATPPQN